jgi:enoyl-CoA hydratase/carnithine racemase
MAEEHGDLLVDRRQDGVTIVTLNRPERLNALRWQTYADLAAVVPQLDARAVVITGAGRGFCSGDDIRDIFGGGDLEVEMPEEPSLDAATRALLSLRIPVVAAVNGPAVGWGMDLALLADLRVAGEQATFASMYVQRGQCPDVATLHRLATLVGTERANRMVLLGEVVDAVTAARWGLVSEVVPTDQVLERALEIAVELAARPPLAVQAAKAGLRRSEPDWEALGRWAAEQHSALFRTADQREAVRAYVEGRSPAFEGR